MNLHVDVKRIFIIGESRGTIGHQFTSLQIYRQN